MQKKGGCGCSMKFGGGKRHHKKTMKKRSRRSSRGGNIYPLNQNPVVAGTNLSARNNISGGKRKKMRGGMFQTLTNSLINKDPLLGGNPGSLMGFGSSGGTQNAINIVSGKTDVVGTNMKPLV
jgi:hypothetical protein